MDAEQIASAVIGAAAIIGNQWREGRKTRKKVDPVANGFATEVTDHLTEIKFTLDEHAKDSAKTHDAMWRAITGGDR